MDLGKVERLLEIVAKSGMAEVELEEDGFKLVVRATTPAGHHAPAPTVMTVPQPFPMPMPGYGAPPIPALPAAPAMSPQEAAPAPNAPAAPSAPAPAAPPPAAEPGSSANETIVQAPIVGTFYEAPSPDSDPFIRVGDHVEVGTVLCIIEAMKLMNEIQSEHAGVVKQVLVKNAEPVEYDQPLFVIEEA
ncbi:MAG: acetyl-CoA carboxylase biotin carboxyl carrier protein [Rhodothermaceae bacterium]|nr:acetyl-CoA carboxylase biotin carboxyl carrier protein [Rhodothermaceae bacterium]